MISPRFGNVVVLLEKSFLYSREGRTYKKYVNAFVCYYCVATLLVGIAAGIKSGFKKTMEETAFFIVIGIITSGQQVYVLHNQDRIKKIIDVLDGYQEEHAELWQVDMFERESILIWKGVRYYNLMMGGYNVFYLFLPFVANLVAGFIDPQLPVIRFPLTCQQFIDDSEPRSWLGLLFTLIGVSWGFFAMEVHIGIETFLYIPIICTRMELKMIKKKLVIIKEVIERKGKYYRVEVERLMRDVTKHHQRALKGQITINSALGFPIALQNLVFSICFCIDLYVLTIFDSNVEPGSLFVSVFSLCVMLVILFMLCYIGESTETTNSEVLQALYDLSWYTEGPEFRKHLVMMIRQARKPFVIHYHGRAKLILHSFMQTLNTSYSCFMMLKSTTGDSA